MSVENTEIADLSDGAQFAFRANIAALRWDYAKSTIMLALMIWAWSTMGPGTVGWYLTALFVAAFTALLGQTIWRHGLRIDLDEAGVTWGWCNPLKLDGSIIARWRRLEWSGLSNIKLRFFSRTPKSEQSGWMMVELLGTAADGTPTKLTFDGNHEAFQPVLRHAWSLAQQRGLPLDEPTLANLEATGIETAEGSPWTS